MPNGTLKLYNKQTNALLVTLDILGTFNIEDNLNETPSNMKVKVITTDTYREEFEVNTVAYHEDTNTWWVIKSDESTYLMTGEYEHEIQLVEYLEFYAYRHLPNCAFAPNTYDLEDMLNRLFDIAKISVSVTYPSFLDKDKIMPFMSFENYTVANAIKHIARAINAIPKMSVSLSPSYQPQLTFINRNGLDTAIVETLNTQFPVAYEKNINTSDQFLTRSVSNITNAKSSALVIAPKQGGFKNIIPNSLTYELSNADNARVFLPSKIDKVEWVRIIPKISVSRTDDIDTTTIFTGYYLNPQTIKDLIIDSVTDFNVFNLADLEALVMPTLEELFQINLNDVLGTTYTSLFRGLFTLKNKFDFDTSDQQSAPYDTKQKVKDKTIHWLPFTNELVMAKTFRDGLTLNQTPDHFRLPLTIATKSAGGNTEIIRIVISTRNTGFYNLKVPNDEVLIQVGYYPIADIKVSVDNNNDSQDEKFFNQSGKVIDAVSVSKLITSHTNDSVDGTKIRNARYDKFPYKLYTGAIAFSISPPSTPTNGDYWFRTDTSILYQRVSGSWVIVSFTSGTTTPLYAEELGLRFVNTSTQQLFITQNIIDGILPLGQIVRDTNQLYVITQRSIDAQIKNGNEYYNVIYTLSRNRVARSENIVADSAVISYKTPDDNLVFRTQLYKDYIELSLTDGNNDAYPYLAMDKALVLSSTLAGTNFDFTVLAKNEYGNTPTVVRYVKNPTIFDLHKAKLMNVNWQDNNILGYRLDSTGATYVQTPIVYTDSVGKATNFSMVFMNTAQLEEARIEFNDAYPAKADPIIPFTDLTKVDTDYYQTIVVEMGLYSIGLTEANYKKDPFEIPVFEYMIQANDDFNQLGNVVVGNDLFTTLDGEIRYHYIINNTTRFTAENADRLRALSAWTGVNDRRVTITRTSATQMDLDLFSVFNTSTRNTSAIINVGFYAVKSGTGETKFLFGINDYTMGDNDDITIYINNWKI